MDHYDSEIAYVDASIGRLVAAISQLPDPTIFILTSDHGEEFKEHGGYYHGSSLYEEQVRVPLIIGVPGISPRIVKTPAQLVDVVPTVLTLLGQRLPESVRGRSLVPDLMGREDPNRPAFSEIHTKRMVRLDHWKLITDCRSNAEELYDLREDPQERRNLIGRRPRDYDRLKSTLNEWFDQIKEVASIQDKDRPEAIDLGRIGDRRALPLLAELVQDIGAESRWRQEAARLLGLLQDSSAGEELWLAVGDDDLRVAEEAAVALGEIKDKRARFVLPLVMDSTDEDLRMRAAIALARVDSPEATPALIEALSSDNWEIQNRAAHYLGYVGDSRAIDPLLRVAGRVHLRSRVALSLSRIGWRGYDKRIMPFLLEMARHDPHAEARRRALVSLGLLGDCRAVRPLAQLLLDDPELGWIPETLSQLGGIGSPSVPGVDLTPERRGLKEGWGLCSVTPSSMKDDLLDSSWCAMNAPSASVVFSLARKPGPALLLARAPYAGRPAEELSHPDAQRQTARSHPARWRVAEGPPAH